MCVLFVVLQRCSIAHCCAAVWTLEATPILHTKPRYIVQRPPQRHAMGGVCTVLATPAALGWPDGACGKVAHQLYLGAPQQPSTLELKPQEARVHMPSQWWTTAVTRDGNAVPASNVHLRPQLAL